MEMAAVWAMVWAAAGEGGAMLGVVWSVMTGAEVSTPATNENKGLNDAIIAVMYAVLIFVVNWSLRLLVIKPLLSSYLSEKMSQKFGQSVIEALFYGASFWLGYVIVLRQPWIWPSSDWWDGMKQQDPPHRYFGDDLKCYILLYMGRYLQAVVSVLIEPKRKDFIEMQIHHITTICLIGLSYNHMYNRVGVVVMLLLDPADVPLHLAKMCKYFECATAADCLFAVFLVVFFVTRLVLYPYVVWSAHIEAGRYLEYEAAEWTCVGLLYVLLVLQCYWFGLILKVLWKMITSGVIEDVRSDDEDDEPSQPALKTGRKSPAKSPAKSPSKSPPKSQEGSKDRQAPPTERTLRSRSRKLAAEAEAAKQQE